MYPQIIKLQSENPTAGQIDMNFKLLSNITLCISLFLFFWCGTGDRASALRYFPSPLFDVLF